jgi:prolyl 4-hydroxylase
VAELVDALGLGSSGFIRGGSSPLIDIQDIMDFILEAKIKDVSVCDRLIDFFQNSDFSINRRNPGETTTGVTDAKKSTDLTIYPFEKHLAPPVEEYLEHLFDVGKKYIDKYPTCNVYSPWGVAESVNIQWYKPGEGFYKWHTERCNAMHPHNNRHLVWMTYLNDIEEGGGTDFMHQNYTVKPKKGKTVIWPSDWTYTHKGQVAPNEDKYIITGWFSYLDETERVGSGGN